MSLRVVPTTLKDANTFVAKHHRHHGKVVGYKFALAAQDCDVVHGVVIVGRPVSREMDNGVTAEVTRLASDGYPNANSMLYGAAARTAREMGYSRIITYTLESEPGTSLVASGWTYDGMTQGGSWDATTRHRTDKHPTGRKKRWIKPLNKAALSDCA